MATKNKIRKLKNPYALKEKLPIDLSLSENPLGCSPKVFEVARKNINEIPLYPDPTSKELKQALSRKHRVSKKKITLGNGSEQLIDLLPRILLEPGDEVIIPKVTFILFENASIISGATTIFSEMTKDFSIDLQDCKNKIANKTKLIFLCNPNNPTGKVLKKKNILEFIKTVRPIDVVVDEANIEFGGESVVNEINRLKNLIVLRTFSKALGLAGLRIGACIARGKLIRAMDKVKQPFSINVLAQKCAVAALRDNKFIKKTKKFMDNQRRFMTKELRKRGFEVIDSQSNNILVRVDKVLGSSTNCVKMLNKNNVSVVGGADFRGVGRKFIRISPRLPVINEKFIEIIDKLRKQKCREKLSG